jgi:hypothetical protein
VTGRRREAAIAAVERRCPRCGAAREPRQEYCAECGLRLPPRSASIATFRRRWLRRLGWYPGDWIWVSIPALAVAIAGAAAAIAIGGRSNSGAEKTIVARAPRAVLAKTPHVPKKPATAAGLPAPAAWPSGRNGWTIAVESYAVAGGTAAPYATAARAAKSGLPDVGVLDSSRYASLHPGYYIVFSGIYSSADEAQAALPSVRASGFGSAYTRKISR